MSEPGGGWRGPSRARAPSAGSRTYRARRIGTRSLGGTPFRPPAPSAARAYAGRSGPASGYLDGMAIEPAGVARPPVDSEPPPRIENAAEVPGLGPPAPLPVLG